MRKLIASAAIGTVLVGGAASLTLPAYAQDSGQGQTRQGPTQGQGQGNDQGKGKDNQNRRHRLAKAAIKTAADTIGIQPKDLLTELKAGKSVADVAAEHGKTGQQVVDAIVAKINAKVDEAAAAGKLPADKAADIKAKAPERVTKMVNAHHQGKAKPDAASPQG